MSVFTPYDSHNIFARISRKEIPCDIVYEDECVLAFHDAFPKAPVHVLVIPKQEGYRSFEDFSVNASAEAMVAFFRAIGIIARQLGLEKGGYRLITNHANNSGQEVYHFHVHILGGKPLGALVSD
jgi:histidine triad (HIT) family protein